MAQLRDRRHRVTSRGWAVLAASVAVVAASSAVLVLTADTHGGGSGTRSRTSTSHASTTETAPPKTSTAIGTYQVGTSTLALQEPGVSAAPRSLSTSVWYPAISAPGGGGLAADRSHAPYPLLVFSQGYDIAVSAYQTLIEDWASAGFVVAAPTYPLTDPSQPVVDENDIVNHPTDLRFVITSVLAQSQQSSSALSGLINPAEVGLVGQSDGGDVSLAVADGSCCQDVRIKAAAILSGAELASFGGTYFAGRQVPLMVVQGTADTINPPGCSVQIYNAAATPKYYLDLLGAAHAPPYTSPGPFQDAIAKVTTDFFDGTLAGQAAGMSALAAAGNVAGIAALSDGPTAPLPPSGCPGAPAT
jgi:predicted dienelactone hydrolase